MRADVMVPLWLTRGIRTDGVGRNKHDIKSRRLFRRGGVVRIPMGKFEELYRTHVHAVFRFAMSVVGDRATAEDLTSEAFLALRRNLDTIDESLLPGWLLTVVRNRARDLWRRKSVETRALDDLATLAPAAAAP